jgi:hypothetical protein
LKREERLFEDGSTLREPNTEIDQMTNGLNFIPSRPMLDILKDYLHVIKYIYDPKHYYERVLCIGLNLKPVNKYRPGIVNMLKTVKAFSKLCVKAGFNKTTGWLYWKTLLTVISKNPKAIEATVNLAAMFIHFYKQSNFINDLTNNEIRSIEIGGA